MHQVMYYKKWLILVFLISFFSCKKEIEIDIPDIDNKPVVNCLFSAGEPFVVELSFPKKQTDTINHYINDAIVSISQKGLQKKVLPHIGKGKYKTDILVPEPGIEYYLEVKVPGFNTVIAKNHIPVTQTTLLSIITESGYRIEPVTGSGEDARIPVHNINANIFEDITIRDYMGIAVVYNYIELNFTDFYSGKYEETSKYRLGYLNSNDPAIKNEGLESFDNHEILLFKDDLFNSQHETVRFNFEKGNELKFWVRFFQFSPEAFQYLKSWIIHNYTKDYDFWEVYEPLPLCSNIENGYGIFAGYSSEQYQVFPDSIITIK